MSKSDKEVSPAQGAEAQTQRKPLNKERWANMIKAAYDRKRVEAENKLRIIGDNASIEEIQEGLKTLRQIDGEEYRMLATLNSIGS